MKILQFGDTTKRVSREPKIGCHTKEGDKIIDKKDYSESRPQCKTHKNVVEL